MRETIHLPTYKEKKYSGSADSRFDDCKFVLLHICLYFSTDILCAYNCKGCLESYV